MPFFNPLLDEETKRRLALTPGINPDAKIPGVAPPSRMPGMPGPSPFPETATPNNLPLPSRGRPGILPGPMEAPSITPLSRREQYNTEKDLFVREGPGRGGSILRGALRGLATPGGGGLGGLVGRLAGGALGGGIDPKGLRETEFNERIRPQILERFGDEDRERAFQMANAKAATDAAMNQMQLRNMQSQIDERVNTGRRADEEQRFKQNEPLRGQAGDVFIDRGTRQPVAQIPKEEKRDLRFTDQGMVDVNKLPPEELKKLRPYQRPRQSGGGGGRSSSQKDMRAANVEMRMFQRLKADADRANREGDEETFAAKMAEMQDAADRIDALYGDVVEVGESGGWPYVKFRGEGGRKAAPAAPSSQKTATRSKQDPLGIR